MKNNYGKTLNITDSGQVIKDLFPPPAYEFCEAALVQKNAVGLPY
jgi:hypothetical protein